MPLIDRAQNELAHEFNLKLQENAVDKVDQMMQLMRQQNSLKREIPSIKAP